MSIRDKKGLTPRQWLGVDAIGSLLIGCWIFWRAARLSDSDTSELAFMGAFILVLYMLPVCLLLGLAALLLGAGLAGIGAALFVKRAGP